MLKCGLFSIPTTKSFGSSSREVLLSYMYSEYNHGLGIPCPCTIDMANLTQRTIRLHFLLFLYTLYSRIPRYRFSCPFFLFDFDMFGTMPSEAADTGISALFLLGLYLFRLLHTWLWGVYFNPTISFLRSQLCFDTIKAFVYGIGEDLSHLVWFCGGDCSPFTSAASTSFTTASSFQAHHFSSF